MRETKVHTRINIHRLMKRGGGGGAGEQVGFGRSFGGGDRMVFRGNGGGSVVSNRVKGGGGHKTLTTNEGSVEFYRDSWRAQIR